VGIPTHQLSQNYCMNLSDSEGKFSIGGVPGERKTQEEKSLQRPARPESRGGR